MKTEKNPMPYLPVTKGELMYAHEVFAPLDADEVHTGTHRRNDDLPAPPEAPQLTNSLIKKCCPEGFSFKAAWDYLNSEGRLLGCVVRYDRPANGRKADKQFKPFS